MRYGRVLESKLVNALVPDAQASTAATAIVGWASLPVLGWFKSYYKGLWVGGRAKLTDTHLLFEPNHANTLAHKDDTSFAVPLASIEDVSVEPGILTRIIAVRTQDATYRVRCFGAATFADMIRQRTKTAA